MIQRIEQTDAALDALYSAGCGYDAAQWRAFGQPDMAARREISCLADLGLARTRLHSLNFLRDAGCEPATPSP